MTRGQAAYEKFNEAMGMATVMPYEKLRDKIKDAWEQTANYIANLENGNGFTRSEHVARRD